MLIGRLDLRRGLSVLTHWQVFFGAPFVAKTFLELSGKSRGHSKHQLLFKGQNRENPPKLPDAK